jgi:hypothetical protein
VTAQLQKDRGSGLSVIVTRWLLSGNTKLCRWCAAFVQSQSDGGLTLSADLTQLEGRDNNVHSYLARKACGWLFDQFNSSVSYILSLVNSASDAEVQDIEAILFDPLLLSFPGGAKKSLAEGQKNSSDRTRDLIERLFARLDSYHAGLKSAASIPELLPSDSHRQAEHRLRQRQMNEARKKAPRGLASILFGEPQRLLYGHASIFYRVCSNGEKERCIQPLGAIEASVELPSLTRVNPHGLEHILLSFRVEEPGS